MGKVRAGIVGDCKKELETGIFTILETSIKLAKGTVESPARDIQVEQVTPPPPPLPIVSLGLIILKDVRLLLCISNLAELKNGTIPKIVNLFENAFELSFTDNLRVIIILLVLSVLII